MWGFAKEINIHPDFYFETLTCLKGNCFEWYMVFLMSTHGEGKRRHEEELSSAISRQEHQIETTEGARKQNGLETIGVRGHFQ